MTDATPRRDSLLRVLWAATMPEALAFVGPPVGLMAFVIALATRSHAPLDRLARDLIVPLFLLSSVLTWLAWMPDMMGNEAPSHRLFRRWWPQRIERRYGPARAARRTPYTSRPVSIVDAFIAPFKWNDHTVDEPGSMAVAQPALVGLGAACSGLALGLIVILLFSPPPAAPLDFEDRVIPYLWTPLIAINLVVALFRVTRSARRLYAWGQERAAAAATAQADVDRARMAALQAQMNPHFLFNALNTVAALLGTDGSRAKATVRSLSGMLKHTLDRSAEPLTTVRDELRFVRDYLAIERERFGSRMDVAYDIDPATEDLAVPTMSLQPLVENAIKHAVMTRIEGGRIRIQVSRAGGGTLRLSVEDDGPGFAPDASDGTGLRNVRERLRTLYGKSATLDIASSSSGARVMMTIPQMPGSTGQSNVHMKAEE